MLKVIAHRPFRDETALEDFQPSALAGFDGAELDLRVLDDGSVAVFHSPILTFSRRPARGAAKEVDAVLTLLAKAGAPSRALFIDVKTRAAAHRAHELLDRLDVGCDIAFICWHADAIAPLREARPAARLFLGVAPLRSAPLTRWLPADFFVFNRFPYVARPHRYRPAARQFNKHNIYVRRFEAGDDVWDLPEGVTGLCFHKMFFNAGLADAARARGVEIAVYGFGSRKDPKIARLKPHIDFAIVDPERSR